MKKSTSRWLTGCGIGCAALVVLAIAVVGGSAYFIHSTTRGFEAAVKSREALEQRFGKADNFRPWADGVVPAERMEAFLSVREATMPAREEIAQSLKKLPMGREEAEKINDLPFWQKLKTALSLAGTGLGLPGSIGKLFEVRNTTLLQEEMGLGEYTFLYVLAYNSWLKHNPDEGITDRQGGVKIETQRFERNVRARVLSMMEAQFAAAPEGAWKKRLAEEVEALRADPRRIPWQDGVPPQIEASLAPFRERLERTYNPLTNEFELGLNQKRGAFSYRAE